MYNDLATLQATGAVEPDPSQESCLVAAYGISAPQDSPRDDRRLRGWVGRTERVFGKGWDKGHFIAHSIGGAVDGLEANVFAQRRSLNRGWSAEGKRFRAMEKYCADNAGVFCFHRPIYADGSEFGILKPHRTPVGRSVWLAAAGGLRPRRPTRLRI